MPCDPGEDGVEAVCLGEAEQFFEDRPAYAQALELLGHVNRVLY